MLYLAIADAAVETFLGESPLRWWVAGAAAIYLALCVAVWRLMPKLWRRLDWANQAGFSLMVFLALMSATAWMPGGLEHGLSLVGQPTSIVLALVSAVMVALSGIFLARLHFVPLAGKIVAGLLAVYGVAAFLLAVNAGTPYASLFHGGSEWTRLPSWLQGATVGGLFLVPLALLLEIVTGLRRTTHARISTFAFKAIALGMSLAITFAGIRIPAGSDSGGVDTPPWLSESHEKPLQGEAGYKQASERLNRMYAALDVINSKIDRSLFEIDALADHLGSDPAAMFHFVRDEIRYEPYTGVLRGALGTLLCRAGNSLDRSLLLAALLQKAGFKAQIASGNLTAQQAQVLVNRLFEPVKPVPSAAPSLAELAPDLSRAMGGDQATLLRVADEVHAYGDKQNTALVNYVDGETSILSNLLSKAGVDAGVITPNDQLLAEARKHYWLQYQDSTGQWIDLDSAFADSEPGKTSVAPTNTFAPDSVPEALYHHLHISLTLRVAQVADGKDGPTTDTVLLDQELRVAEQQGKEIIVGNSPVPPLNFMKPGATPTEVWAPTRGYQTGLQVGDRAVPGKYFDLAGQVSDTLGGPVGDAVTNAGGIGKSTGGLFGGMSGAVGGGSSQGDTTRIVGEWVDYKLTSPRAGSEALVSHNYHRDIIAPTQVTSWSAESPENPQQIPTNIDTVHLQQRLFWFTELLPVTGAIVADYAGYLAFKSSSENRVSIDTLTKMAFGVSQAGSAATLSVQPDMSGLLLAAGAAQIANNLGRTRFPNLKSYFGGPGLVAYETATGDTSGRLKRGYDLIAFPPRIVGDPASAASGIHRDASLLHLLGGVLATRLEWVLTASASDGSRMEPTPFNATRVFAVAKDHGVPVVVLRPGADGLKKLAETSLPESVKAELSATLGTGDDVIVPVSPVWLDGRQQFAWWRFEPASGQIRGVMPGGRGQSMLEYVWIGFSVALCTLDFATSGPPEPGHETPTWAFGACLATALFFGSGPPWWWYHEIWFILDVMSVVFFHAMS